jgi:hypothetical protein
MPDDVRLANALRGLPVPELSPEFDERVLAALRVPIPWWQCMWQPAKPLLLGTSCSFALMLLLLHWTLTAPIPSSLASPLSGAGGLIGRSTVASPPSLDALLDSPNLTAGSLAAAWNAPPAPIPPVGLRPEPRRRAQLRRPISLMA